MRGSPNGSATVAQDGSGYWEGKTGPPEKFDNWIRHDQKCEILRCIGIEMDQ